MGQTTVKARQYNKIILFIGGFQFWLSFALIIALDNFYALK